MDKKKIYQIYVGIMKLHRKYVGKHSHDYLDDLVTDINVLNNSFNSNFCNAMTDILRRWFLKGFHGVDETGITAFYTDIWKFHKKYLELPKNDEYWDSAMNELRQYDKKYGIQIFRDFALAIMGDLETSEMDVGKQGADTGEDKKE